MTAIQFYEKKHGNNLHFLSKDAICTMMQEYVDYRKEIFDRAKAAFNTEQWGLNREEVRKYGAKRKP
jgi:hypothetical protein